MNKYSFTFIIGYRHKNDRFTNLRKVLEWVNGFAGVDVIIVEQDSHSKIDHINLDARHIFVKNDGHYNRSWAFNIGVKLSKSNIIVFSDSDLIMDPENFINSLKEIENYDMVSPYKSVLDLLPNEVNKSIDDLNKITRHGRGETDNQTINICGGMSIFRKDSIMRIGGWCEEFCSWGGEDDYLTILVKKLLKYKEMPYRCYHLYHSRDKMDMQQYQKNLNLLNKLGSISDDELFRFANNNRAKNSFINKYDK